MITVYKLEDNYAAIGIDEFPCMDSPRVECDNLGTFITWMDHYASPDRNEYDSIEEFYEYNGISESTCLIPGLAKMVIMPVYCMVHSEVRYSTKSFGCPWDSGFAGFIYATYEDIKKEYGCKYVTKNILFKVREALTAEVKAYDQWCNDPSYEVVIFDDKGEVVDSMSGFYETEDIMDFFDINEDNLIGEYRNMDKLVIAILKKEI
jgi:hypothetical protein